MMDAEDFTSEALSWSWRIVETLHGLRLSPVQYEAQLCGSIAGALEGARIPFEREVSLGGQRRIDFLCAGGVGIEVKKGSPNAAALVSQARRYCTSDRVLALVLVVERNVIRASEIIKRTPVFYVGLNSNWGMAI